jgi:hypothetical protein
VFEIVFRDSAPMPRIVVEQAHEGAEGRAV